MQLKEKFNNLPKLLIISILAILTGSEISVGFVAALLVVFILLNKLFNSFHIYIYTMIIAITITCVGEVLNNFAISRFGSYLSFYMIGFYCIASLAKYFLGAFYQRWTFVDP